MLKENNILIEALISQGYLDIVTHSKIKTKIQEHYLAKGISDMRDFLKIFGFLDFMIIMTIILMKL